VKVYQPHGGGGVMQPHSRLFRAASIENTTENKVKRHPPF
jgi:hypothetical protein